MKLMILIAQTIPDPQTPPGLGSASDTLLGWLRWGIPIAGLAAVMVGLSLWAVGSSSSDYQQAARGKKAIAAGALVAIVSGVLPVMWNGLVTAG
jgi:hypothetical protein